MSPWKKVKKRTIFPSSGKKCIYKLKNRLHVKKNFLTKIDSILLSTLNAKIFGKLEWLNLLVNISFLVSQRKGKEIIAKVVATLLGVKNR